MMQIQYELTQKDIWKYYAFTFFRRRPKLGLVTVFMFFFVVINIILRIVNFTSDQLMSLGLFILIPVLVIGSQVYNVKVKLKKAGMYGTYSFETGEDGYVVSTPIAKEQSKWARLTEVRSTGSYYFLINQTNAGYVIPKRAFASQNEAEAFEQIVCASIEQAAGKPPIVATKKMSILSIVMWSIFGFLIVVGILNYIIGE